MSDNIKKIFFIILAVMIVVMISFLTANYIVNKKTVQYKEEIASLNKKIDDNKEEYTKKIQDLKTQITNLKNTLESTDSNSENNTSSSQEGTYVIAVSGPKTSLGTWKFEFNNDIDSQTLKIGNINLYSSSDTSTSQGKKIINNRPIKSLKYNKGDKSLTILVDTVSLKCSSCTWELDFTDKIEDMEGNSITPKAFSF